MHTQSMVVSLGQSDKGAKCLVFPHINQAPGTRFENDLPMDMETTLSRFNTTSANLETKLEPLPCWALSEMFKEIIISAAILLGFALNVFFVDHPDVYSYTVAFIIGLAILSPVIVWRYLRSMVPEKVDNNNVDSPTTPSLSQSLGLSVRQVSLESNAERGEMAEYIEKAGWKHFEKTLLYTNRKLQWGYEFNTTKFLVYCQVICKSPYPADKRINPRFWRDGWKHTPYIF